MSEFEIRIRLADAPPGYAEHVAWAVGRVLDAYPHLGVTLEPPRPVNPPGSTAEQLPPHLLAVIVPRMPAYESTACQTGRALLDAIPDHLGSELDYELADWGELMHDRCRENHKFTGQPCGCACHQEASR